MFAVFISLNVEHGLGTKHTVAVQKGKWKPMSGVNRKSHLGSEGVEQRATREWERSDGSKPAGECCSFLLDWEFGAHFQAPSESLICGMIF